METPTNIPTIDLGKPNEVIKGEYQIVTPVPPPDPKGGNWGTRVSSMKSLPHGDLLLALYFMWEAQQRCSMDFFLTRETAKAASTSHMLDGDSLDMGVRKLEWVSDNKDLLFIFLANEPVKILSETVDLLELEYKGVKINLRIYEDNDCIRNLIPVHYEHEDFWLPNQFERFVSEYDH